MIGQKRIELAMKKARFAIMDNHSVSVDVILVEAEAMLSKCGSIG